MTWHLQLQALLTARFVMIGGGRGKVFSGISYQQINSVELEGLKYNLLVSLLTFSDAFKSVLYY